MVVIQFYAFKYFTKQSLTKNNNKNQNEILVLVTTIGYMVTCSSWRLLHEPWSLSFFFFCLFLRCCLLYDENSSSLFLSDRNVKVLYDENSSSLFLSDRNVTVNFLGCNVLYICLSAQHWQQSGHMNFSMKWREVENHWNCLIFWFRVEIRMDLHNSRVILLQSFTPTPDSLSFFIWWKSCIEKKRRKLCFLS